MSYFWLVTVSSQRESTTYHGHIQWRLCCNKHISPLFDWFLVNVVLLSTVPYTLVDPNFDEVDLSDKMQEFLWMVVAPEFSHSTDLRIVQAAGTTFYFFANHWTLAIFEPSLIGTLITALKENKVLSTLAQEICSQILDCFSAT